MKLKWTSSIQVIKIQCYRSKEKGEGPLEVGTSRSKRVNRLNLMKALIRSSQNVVDVVDQALNPLTIQVCLL